RDADRGVDVRGHVLRTRPAAARACQAPRSRAEAHRRGRRAAREPRHPRPPARAARAAGGEGRAGGAEAGRAPRRGARDAAARGEAGLGSHWWREDPAPIAAMMAKFATMSDDAPDAAERRAARERKAAERAVLDCTKGLDRVRTRVTLALSRRYIPLRVEAK